MKTLLSIAILPSLLLDASPAHAGDLQELERLRGEVAQYDPNGDLAQVVWDLGTLSHSPRAAVAQEARFLRAHAVTDVLFYLELHRAPWLRTRISRAVGVPASQLADAVRSDLETLEGPFVSEARALEAAIGMLQSADLPRPGPADVRGSILLFGRLLPALRAGSQEALTRMLASIGRDPCDAGGACAAPYAGLTAGSRRALEGFAVVARALRVLSRPDLGDPLAALAFPRIEETSRLIRNLAMPAEMGESAWATLEADGPEGVPTPDVLVSIGPGEARVSSRPVFSIDAEGRLAVRPGAVPTYPAAEPVAGRGAMRRLADLVRAARGGSGSVGLFVDPAARASDLAEALGALSRSGSERVSLALRRPDGAIGFVPVRLAAPGRYPPSGRGAGSLRVVVTRVGYWLLGPGDPPLHLPLAGGPHGAHDAEALGRGLGARPTVSAAVASRGDLPVRPLLLAALALTRAGTNAPTLVVTP